MTERALPTTWHVQVKTGHTLEHIIRNITPIRYWLHNDAASLLIWPWSMRIARVNDWIRYRTYNRYHVVKTGMEPGYVDVTERMLHVNFNMLKDFVEIEKAHMWKWSENSFNGTTWSKSSYLGNGTRRNTRQWSSRKCQRDL